MAGAFDNLTAAGQYGLASALPSTANTDVTPGIAVAAGPSPMTATSFLDPSHPMFVFGVLLAAAAGLVGIAGSARFGPAKGSLSLGKS